MQATGLEAPPAYVSPQQRVQAAQVSQTRRCVLRLQCVTARAARPGGSRTSQCDPFSDVPGVPRSSRRPRGVTTSRGPCAGCASTASTPSPCVHRRRWRTTQSELQVPCACVSCAGLHSYADGAHAPCLSRCALDTKGAENAAHGGVSRPAACPAVPLRSSPSPRAAPLTCYLPTRCALPAEGARCREMPRQQHASPFLALHCKA